MLDERPGHSGPPSWFVGVTPSTSVAASVTKTPPVLDTQQAQGTSEGPPTNEVRQVPVSVTQTPPVQDAKQARGNDEVLQPTTPTETPTHGPNQVWEPMSE